MPTTINNNLKVVETEFFGASAADKVFTTSFVAYFDSPTSAPSKWPQNPAGAELATLVGFSNYVTNKGTSDIKTKFYAAGLLKPTDIFMPDYVNAADDITLATLRACAQIATVVPYLNNPIEATAIIQNDITLLKSYDDDWIQKAETDALTTTGNTESEAVRLHAKSQELEAVRHNLLSMTENDDQMRRLRNIARGVYIGSIAVAVAFVLGAIGAFVTGRHGILYVTSATALVLVLSLAAFDVLRKVVNYWGGR